GASYWPRKRRTDGQQPGAPGDLGRGKGKKKGKDGFRKEHYVFIGLLGIFVNWCCVHFYHAIRNTYPVPLQPAQCLFEKGTPFFVHCKDAAQHNKKVLEWTLQSAGNLSTEPFAKASATYALSLSMRTRDTEMGGLFHEWMRVPMDTIECTQLIDVDEIDLMKETPRGICAQANYRAAHVRDHRRALEDLNVYFDMMFLMSMYGSEFHEGTMRYTVDGQLSFQGRPVNSPVYAGIVENHYSNKKEDRQPYSFLMTEMTQRRNEMEIGRLIKDSKDRMGVSLLTVVLRDSLAAMRRCNPPANITWMEYHSRALFKRADYEGEDDGCGWTSAEDSLWQKIMLIYYDANFRFRRMLNKI
ncbi:hypothetical protein PMAYCL1PPCAC_15455, partial [Pristionchus mayeri]